jgi:hypothetical protein
MLELLLIGLGFKVVEGGSVWLYLKERKRRKLLNNTDVEPTHLMLVDDYLARKAGPSSKLERLAISKIVATARKVVNTQAFESVVAGVVNSNSEWKDKEHKVLCLGVSIKPRRLHD